MSQRPGTEPAWAFSKCRVDQIVIKSLFKLLGKFVTAGTFDVWRSSILKLLSELSLSNHRLG